MSTGHDDQDWLRRIGVTTVDDDHSVECDSGVYHSPGDVDPRGAVADSGYDDADPMPPGGRDVEATGGETPPVGPDRHGDVVDLDSGYDTDEDRTDHSPRRFNPWVAGAFAAIALVATITTVTAALVSGPDPAPPPPPATSKRIAPSAPPSTPVAPETADAPLPFTASADCPTGSTAAQAVADPNSPTPWICVRSVDGQVLTIDLGRAYVITAVSITPGAINKTGSPGQQDPWLQHRAVTRLQWQFNDTDNTVLKQDTRDAAAKRGEANMPVPRLLASQIKVIIQETIRPPALAPTTAPTPPPNPGDTILGPILGGPNQAPSDPAAQPAPVWPDRTDTTDPSDGTFAVSSVKIIGHKAI